MIVDNCVC